VINNYGTSRRRIGLAALLSAFGLVALWLGWSRAVVDLLDGLERARAAAGSAK
jgi:hypothetical protein